ncbi:MAG: ATP-binding cassette domain-containing protein [Clostridia bacterium]|nr:ATP-binding cassette domain-containing protein [Clostridia bacterium]
MVQIQNLTFTYNGCEQPALSQISLEIPRGSFCVLAGPSGCGKTTLLRLLKKELAPYGTQTGHIQIAEAGFVGFVMQNPDNQIVTDKVWHELTFGGENLGLSPELIERRVGEVAAYFGLTELLSSNTDVLSGGQKQILNLAAGMVCNPSLLLLDEPTAMLDPIAAANFRSLLRKMNEELGVTILLVEHRLEDVLAMADRVFVMDAGKMVADFNPGDFGKIASQNDIVASVMPEIFHLYTQLGIQEDLPLTVREGRAILRDKYPQTIGSVPVEAFEPGNQPVVQAENIYFRYTRTSPDIVQNLSLEAYPGECFCVVGGNGVGKSTLLKVLSGVAKPYRGSVKVEEPVALLPQNPKLVFLADTVRGDYESYLKALGNSNPNFMDTVADALGIAHLLDRHPYDLSGGEQQKAAIGKLLLANPKVLLMDEPTKGLDLPARRVLGKIVEDLKQKGVCVILVTHDLDFCSHYADWCGFLSEGKVLAQSEPHAFFSENCFYTTVAHRVGRDLCANGITPEEITAFLQKERVPG